MIRSYEAADEWSAAPMPVAVEAFRRKRRRVGSRVFMEEPLGLRLFRDTNLVKNMLHVVRDNERGPVFPAEHVIGFFISGT
jgi:hypothetical protein